MTAKAIYKYERIWYNWKYTQFITIPRPPPLVKGLGNTRGKSNFESKSEDSSKRAVRLRANALKGRAMRIWTREDFERGLSGRGNFAPCGARPGALPLDSTTFEKVDETFTLPSATKWISLKKQRASLLGWPSLSGCGVWFYSTRSRYRNVTICARVQFSSGLKAVSEVPVVMFRDTAH